MYSESVQNALKRVNAGIEDFKKGRGRQAAFLDDVKVLASALKETENTYVVKVMCPDGEKTLTFKSPAASEYQITTSRKPIEAKGYEFVGQYPSIRRAIAFEEAQSQVFLKFELPKGAVVDVKEEPKLQHSIVALGAKKVLVTDFNGSVQSFDVMPGYTYEICKQNYGNSVTVQMRRPFPGHGLKVLAVVEVPR